ncbi:MAG: helix-turn-helix domain-containing protein [Opitutaceae bacterium]
MPSLTSLSAATRHEHELGFRVWRQNNSGHMAVPHTHPDIEVNFLFEGGFSYLHGGAITPVEAGRFTVLWGGVPHQTVAPGIVGQGIWITLPLAWFLQWQLPHGLQDRLLRGEVISARPDPADRPQLERWLEDARSKLPGRRRVLLLEMEARFNRLALATSRPRPRSYAGPDGAGQIARVTRFIAEHYREPLTVPAIADDAGLHPKYLMRIFKKQCGVGVWEYVTRLRVSHAQRLLITTDTKVVDVALESGFASVAPFYQAFKAYAHQQRPLAYRRQHRLPAPA